MPTIPKKDESAQTVSTDSDKKDPNTAAIISLAGLILLSVPSAGYMYLGDMRKGLIYLAVMWGLVIAETMVYFGAAFFTGIGGFCCLPVYGLHILLGLFIVYDVYMVAKGEASKLPSI